MNDVPNAIMVADKDAGAVFYLFFPDQFIREYDLYKCIYNFFENPYVSILFYTFS